MHLTSDLYTTLPGRYGGLGDLEYPFHDRAALVTTHVRLASFMQYNLGFFDDETVRLEPIENAFVTNVLPNCPE